MKPYKFLKSNSPSRRTVGCSGHRANSFWSSHTNPRRTLFKTLSSQKEKFFGPVPIILDKVTILLFTRSSRLKISFHRLRLSKVMVLLYISHSRTAKLSSFRMWKRNPLIYDNSSLKRYNAASSEAVCYIAWE